MLLVFRKVFADQLRCQPLAFAQHFELDQQTFLHLAGAATNRIETHHFLTRALDNFFRDFRHRRDLFVRGAETSISIHIANNGSGSIAHISMKSGHVELPLEMFSQRWWTCQKLFEGGSVFLVFDLLCFVTGIEIVLELASEVDLLKSIPLWIVSDAFVGNSFFVFRGCNRLAAVAVCGGQAR